MNVCDQSILQKNALKWYLFVLDTSSTDDNAFSNRPREFYSTSVPQHITNFRNRRSTHLDDSEDELDMASILMYSINGCT